MVLKILQLNLFQGIYLERVLRFIKSENIDLLHFQEVSAGKMSKGGIYNYPPGIPFRQFTTNEKSLGIDCFEEIKKATTMKGLIVPTTNLINDPKSYIGNATFFKPAYKLLESKTLWLEEFFEVNEDFTDISKLSRASLITKLKLGKKTLTTVNTHLAWGPNSFDEPYKIKQAEKLQKVIKTLSKPLILTGDFNVTPATKTASMFDDLGRNLVKEYGITNTLNPRIHSAKSLFPQGIAVDYIFVSNDIRVKDFKLVDEPNLSDHFGILLSFEVD